MDRSIARIGVALGVLILNAATASAAVSFNFTNGGTATAQMMAGAAQAGALWSAQFHDPITINITINAASYAGGIVAHTDTYYDPYAYTDVRNALLADRLSADDLSSSSALQSGSAFSMLINRTRNNPAGVVSTTPYFDTGLGGPGQAGAENNSTVRIPSANAKALGLYPGNGAGTDGILTFSTNVSFDYDRSNGINASQADFVGVAAHEIGHMLGFVSGVDVLAGNAAAPGLYDNQLKFVTPLDLYRFSSRSIGTGGGIGVNDWTADSAVKYFSVDGGSAFVAEFSTGATYEESHWKNNIGLGLMDPTVAAGELLTISSNDLRAFDVIGYNLSVPEPASATLVLALGVIMLTGRRQRRSASAV